MERNKKYAKLVLDMLQLQPDQRLILRSEAVHIDLLAAITEEAYDRGSKHVDVRMSSQRFSRLRLEHSADKHLEYVPEEFIENLMLPVKDRAAFVRIDGMGNPKELRGVDPVRLSRMSAAVAGVRQPYARVVMQHQIPWMVAAAPTSGWAEQVLGRPDTEALWEMLEKILSLDHEDPSAVWQEKCRKLEERAKRYNAMKIKTLHCVSEDTDITFSLAEESRWKGGRENTTYGHLFLPNLPTEEIFTAPDYRYTEGHVAASRSFELMGKVVEGARFEFKEGKVVDFSARTGEEVLASFFAMQDGNRSLGELAVVDSSSPIAQLGTLFYNTLIDENAAIHFAFGSAYEATFEGSISMDEQTKRKKGFNVSMHHHDVAIGTTDMNVSATCFDGSSHEIMRDGLFVED